MTLAYEPEHFGSVLEHMREGDTFIDIGAYDGTTSLIVADKVGPENLVIVEPAEYNWPTIKLNWEKKYGSQMPLAAFPGFVASEDKPNSRFYIGEWPPQCGNPMRTDDKLDFRWLHYVNEDESCAALPRLTIDTIVNQLASTKLGITMDVEGSELQALLGAKHTLTRIRPLFWISVHPQFMQERFGQKAEDLYAFMDYYFYKRTLLKSDQEEHFLFEPYGAIEFDSTRKCWVKPGGQI
jgi:FkbM family methyltransferase